MLRVLTGIIYCKHGLGKFQGLEGTGNYFGSLGIPQPDVMAIVVATVEGMGGVLLVMGLFTRVVSALQAFVVFVAIALVHFDAGMFGKGGYEFASLLMIASLCLVLEGGGKVSLDSKLS